MADPAVISGVVLENQTGYALARTRVKLSRLGRGKMVQAAVTHTGRTGQFTFPSVEPGIYTISGTRAGFAETFHGQRRDNAPPLPFAVAANKNVFIELRLKRFAAITGRLIDENRAGLPGITVNAYDASSPSHPLGTAVSDDRGIYRIPGLLPGRYFVRTAAAILEDRQSLMPTYFPFAASDLRDATALAASFDNDTRDADIQPLPGALFRLQGSAGGCIPGTEVRVTLSHETGRWDVRCGCTGDFAFAGAAPGHYEVIALGMTPSGPGYWFAEVDLRGDRNLGMITLNRGPEVRIQPAGARLLARRRDRAGPGNIEEIHGRWAPIPGFWELTAIPPEGQHINNIGSSYFRGLTRGDPAWFQHHIESFTAGDLRISFAPGQSVRGRVSLGNSPAMAAPVYLLPVSAPAKMQVNGLRRAISDENGNFEFRGMASGEYLLLASWDLSETTEEVFRAARATAVTLSGTGGVTQEIEIYQAP